MKHYITLFYLLISISTFGQSITLLQWNEESKTNNRLLPKYGHKQKTAEQLLADEKFISSVMQQEQFNGDRLAASNHMIGLGFQYLYRGDIKTAMYRFNQAYLLDSLNSEIYWGYGAVYMTLGDMEKGKAQYEAGLSVDPNNTHLLTDYGTYFMQMHYIYYGMRPNEFIKNPKEEAEEFMMLSLKYLTQSFELNPNDQNTAFKLSTAYYNKNECENAWEYYNICKSLGGQPITSEYTQDLKKKCKRKK
jgi:tetratricopeptide (TPR) repeat protein